MSTLSELVKAHQGQSSHAEIEWLQLLMADWQLVADLVFADLVLWIPDSKGGFIAAGHARPSSDATIFYRDITGSQIRKDWAQQVKSAFEDGRVVEDRSTSTEDGLTTRLTAIPDRKSVV